MDTATYIHSETEFDSLIASEGLVVVDFTAQWCGPCKLVAPLMDRLAKDYGDRLQVFKLDLDENKSLAKRLGIRSIPAVMLFRKGKLLETLVGVKKYEEFTKVVDQCLTGSVQETRLDQAETIDSSLPEPGFTQNSDHSL